jgi:serine/threonine protein kinase
MKVKTIGEGPFSKIKLYIDSKQNKKVAIKKYNLFILKKKTKM